MKEVVIIDHEQFTKRRKEVFLIDELRAKGILVTVWDISQLLFPDVHIVDALHTEYHNSINSLEQLEKVLKQCNIKNSVFIVECFQNWKNRKIFKLLSKYKCLMVKIDFYANSIITEPKINKLRRLFSKDFFYVLKCKFEYVAYDVYKLLYGMKNYRYIFSSSNIAYRTNCINHPDYDLFHSQYSDNRIPYKYAVFCDNYFPDHPDLKSLAKVSKLPNAEKYRSSLNKFFSYIENRFNLKVIIAAHPKSDYKGFEFDGRAMIKYRTNELIRHCDMVLLHSSNSISFAILADKPIVFITNDSYNFIKRNEIRIDALSSLLGKTYYNIDGVEYSTISYDKLTSNVRLDYIYTYLTSKETEHLNNLEILLTFLRNLSDDQLYT